jgi:hypothetical protein
VDKPVIIIGQKNANYERIVWGVHIYAYRISAFETEEEAYEYGRNLLSGARQCYKDTIHHDIKEGK